MPRQVPMNQPMPRPIPNQPGFQNFMPPVRGLIHHPNPIMPQMMSGPLPFQMGQQPQIKAELPQLQNPIANLNFRMTQRGNQQKFGRNNNSQDSESSDFELRNEKFKNDGTNDSSEQKDESSDEEEDPDLDLFKNNQGTTPDLVKIEPKSEEISEADKNSENNFEEGKVQVKEEDPEHSTLFGNDRSKNLSDSNYKSPTLGN